MSGTVREITGVKERTDNLIERLDDIWNCECRERGCGWSFIIERCGADAPIIYCPFCGERLVGSLNKEAVRETLDEIEERMDQLRSMLE